MFDTQLKFSNVQGLVCKKMPLGFALLFSFMLSACGSDNELASLPPMSETYSALNPIYIVEGIQYIEIAVLPEMQRIDLLQRGQIIAFLEGYSNQKQGDLIVRIPSTKLDQAAKKMSTTESSDQSSAPIPQASLDLAAVNSVLADIKALIAGYGIPSGMVKYQVYEQRMDASTPALIVLTYEGIQAAAVKRCVGISGDVFSYDDVKVLSKSFSSDKGCSRQHNLAAMIDNPMDLKYPQGLTPSNTDRSYAQYQKYVKGDITSSATELTGVTISEIAQ